MVKLDTRTLVGWVIGIIIAATFIPVIGGLVAGAQTYTYSTYNTLNNSFADNDTENCPAYWDNVITDNRQINWSQPDGRVWDNGDNGTSSWYQTLTVSNLRDVISSATIKAKFRLYENTGIASISAWVYLDDGTDNHLIWESTSIDNTLTYTSIENAVSSYITTTGTYYIHIGENVTTVGDDDIITYWDDASFEVISRTTDKTTAQTMAEMLPLFFIIGIILAAVFLIYNGREK